jgi:hypothetical protein
MVPSPVSERRRRQISVQWLLLAALALAVIVFATLCPMQWRPRLFANPDLERFAAFAALGFAAKLALPRKHLWTILGLGLVAAGLEAAQHLAPGRDAHLRDAVVKAIGAVTGVQLGLVSLIARRALARRIHQGLKAYRAAAARRPVTE